MAPIRSRTFRVSMPNVSRIDREHSANQSITERFDSPHSMPFIRPFDEVNRVFCVGAKISEHRKFFHLRVWVLRLGAR